jgi:hypothetical protein
MLWHESKLTKLYFNRYYRVLKTYLSMALLPFVGPWPLFSFVILYTVGSTFRTGDRPVARPLPIHRTNVHRHPCLKWDSN